jgi:hypothetical protein
MVNGPSFVGDPAKLWYLAVGVALASVTVHGFNWYARRRFRHLLKAPLTEEVEQQTHLWERHIAISGPVGIGLSALSLLCFAGWLVA